jgi:adenylate cyclase class 2
MAKTQYEVERKRQVTVPKEAFIAMLIEKGFTAFQSPAKEIDTYYTRPDVDYMVTVECLRIREKDDFAELTYKPPTNTSTQVGDGMMAKEETNVILQRVNDVPTAKKFLENIGMIELVEVNKHRQVFKHEEYKGVVIALDEVKHAGIFIETEVISDDQAAAVALIEEIEALINVDDMPTVTLPYRDLVMEGVKGEK